MREVDRRWEQDELQRYRNAQGVEVLGDELKFLLVPENVEKLIVHRVLVPQILEYQRRALRGEVEHGPIERAVFVMMGGSTWASWIYDGLRWMDLAGLPEIEFDSMGVSYYKSPGQPYSEPRITRDITFSVADKKVLVIEDLADKWKTAPFVAEYFREHGAIDVVLSAAYLKGEIPERSGISGVFWFGEVPKDTWIIFSREQVETMMKRVPYWINEKGLSGEQCLENLKMIGYPESIVEEYFTQALAAAVGPNEGSG